VGVKYMLESVISDDVYSHLSQDLGSQFHSDSPAMQNARCQNSDLVLDITAQ